MTPIRNPRSRNRLFDRPAHASKRGWIAGLLVVAVILAGCTGGKSNTAKGSDAGVPTVAPAGQHSENTCSIEGTVTDDEFVAVVGAEVGLFGEPDIPSVKSAQDGGFSFSNLPPKSYIVTATKVGYDTASQKVECAAGARHNAQLTLKPLITADIGYVVIYPVQTGLIGCAFGLPTTGINDQPQCHTSPLGEEGTTNTLTYKRDAFKITGMVIEMTWNAANPTVGGRWLQVEFSGLTDPTNTTNTTDDRFFDGVPPGEDPEGFTSFAFLKGTSPLNLRSEAHSGGHVYNESWPKDLTFAGQPARSTVPCLRNTEPFPNNVIDEIVPQCIANPPDATDDSYSGVVYQQKFELNLALFYNGAEIPPGFTMIGA